MEKVWFLVHEIYSKYAKEFDNMSVSEKKKRNSGIVLQDGV